MREGKSDLLVRAWYGASFGATGFSGVLWGLGAGRANRNDCKPLPCSPAPLIPPTLIAVRTAILLTR